MTAISVPTSASLGRLVCAQGETLALALRRTLLEMILFGAFERGMRLYPQQLATRFDVSLTPVREALMQLSSEGFIEATPRRGFRIKTPSSRQVVELWQARLAFEATSVELAVARLSGGEITDRDLLPLEAIQRRRDNRGARMTAKEHIGLNAEFHHRLVELGGNTLLASLYRGIQVQLLSAWVQRGQTTWRSRLEVDAVEHHAIIEALRAREAGGGVAVIRSHIGRSLEGALQDLARAEASERASPAPEPSGPLEPPETRESGAREPQETREGET